MTRESQSRSTQAERRARTEAALVHAAAELVVSSGVGALTLAAVGERAGYSRGIVTHHFGSKQGLIQALARSVQVGFVSGLDGRAPGLDRLLALLDGYLEAVGQESTGWRAFIVLWAGAVTSTDLQPLLRERDEQFRADLRADLEAGIEAGEIRADVDPAAASVAILGQLRGVGLAQLIDPDATTLVALRRTVTQGWRHALATGSER